MEYLDIWIPSAVSVLGFAVTIYTVNRKISSISKERIKGERQDLYIELYSQLEELIKDNSIIFDKVYFDSLSAFQGKIKLIATNEVIIAFRDVLNFIFSKQKEFEEFANSNDPEMDSRYYEYIENETNGEVAEIFHGYNEMEKYQALVLEYKQENIPSKKEIKDKVTSVLNEMRKDIGNDFYFEGRANNNGE